jgi:hypothetical protein
MLLPTYEEHLLSDGRLARIDVGNDADVAKFGDVDGHGNRREVPTKTSLPGRAKVVRPTGA